MKAKRNKIFIILLIIVAISIAGCNGKSNNTESPDSSEKGSTSSMTITMLPSPPESKTTNDASKIKSFTELIENCDKKEIQSADINGWQILVTIQTNDEIIQYSLLNDTLKIDSKCYKLNAQDLKEKIEKIYEDI